MPIPDEDPGPSWLRDWHAIEADLTAMEDVAAHLRAEVETNYRPHLDLVRDDLSAELPEAAEAFVELASLLATHTLAMRTTTDFAAYHGATTGALAGVAADMSKRYAQADAFAVARAREVDDLMTQYDVPQRPASPGTQPLPVVTSVPPTMPDGAH